MNLRIIKFIKEFKCKRREWFYLYQFLEKANWSTVPEVDQSPPKAKGSPTPTWNAHNETGHFTLSHQNSNITSSKAPCIFQAKQLPQPFFNFLPRVADSQHCANLAVQQDYTHIYAPLVFFSFFFLMYSFLKLLICICIIFWFLPWGADLSSQMTDQTRSSGIGRQSPLDCMGCPTYILLYILFH